MKSENPTVELGEGLKQLKGRVTPYEDPISQLTWTHGGSQKLSYQLGSIQELVGGLDTYREEDCLFWPQWEEMCPILERFETLGK